MNLYTKEEVDYINKLKEKNDKLEKFFQQKRVDWNNLIDPLIKNLNNDITREKTHLIIDSQTNCLSYRQALLDEISTLLDKRSKQDVRIKKLKQDKFIWYATSFGVKTNTGEKTILIEAHLGEEQRNIELIENYIEFLRSTSKNLESLQFTFKNIIELFNYLSRN
jgi:hypothetical protein